MRYYAIQQGGELCRLGGPAMIVRLQTRQERDEWVATHTMAEAIPANHIWVKQANWKVKLEKGPKNWQSWWILQVSYDMTAA